MTSRSKLTGLFLSMMVFFPLLNGVEAAAQSNDRDFLEKSEIYRHLVVLGDVLESKKVRIAGPAEGSVMDIGASCNRSFFTNRLKALKIDSKLTITNDEELAKAKAQIENQIEEERKRIEKWVAVKEIKADPSKKDTKESDAIPKIETKTDAERDMYKKSEIAEYLSAEASIFSETTCTKDLAYKKIKGEREGLNGNYNELASSVPEDTAEEDLYKSFTLATLSPKISTARKKLSELEKTYSQTALGEKRNQKATASAPNKSKPNASGGDISAPRGGTTSKAGSPTVDPGLSRQ